MTEAEQLYRVRPVTGSDARLLGELDGIYSARLGIGTTATPGSASFHARTGHSFIAEEAGEALGFVLASAIWTGGRPLVRLERLAARDEAAAGVLHALLAALVKSSYDAGVYDLLAEVPQADTAAAAALNQNGFAAAPVNMFTRTLGSRGQVTAQ